jgi:hypothetical protein
LLVHLRNVSYNRFSILKRQFGKLRQIKGEMLLDIYRIFQVMEYV